MKKQIGFVFRLLDFNAIEPEKSSAAWSAYVKSEYLDKGWEVFSSEVVRAEANTAFVGVTFVKYEDVEEKAKK